MKAEAQYKYFMIERTYTLLNDVTCNMVLSLTHLTIEKRGFLVRTTSICPLGSHVNNLTNKAIGWPMAWADGNKSWSGY
ncbi:MAG: hypothetical protein NVSMB49_09890 [Ktedonobacteraceae bacterium]